ncbi:MAG: hypothetical protein WAQ08_15945 [Aquabacterium sp.]|uniref:hypothetical protein n=1 Tax=Aquabacterium sp. TaxID=1872578 RepID=UPI003BB1A259
MDRKRTASLLLPPSTGVLEIDIEDQAHADASFSILDKIIGKCDTDFDFRVQGDLLQAFCRAAREKGAPSAGARLRHLMALDCYGESGVASMVTQHLSRSGIVAANPIPADVRAKG